MSFYDRWAKSIAAGDWLTAAPMRPYHTAHAAVAREAHALAGSAEPFDEAVGRRIWGGWLGERTFYQDPLYPYLLAVVYRVCGPRTGAVVLLQSLMGLLVVALVFHVAHVVFDETVAAAAGVLAALYGPLIFYESLLLRPVLVAVTGLAALAAILWATRRLERRGAVLAAGLASGVAVLAQASALLFAFVALVFLAFRARRAGRPLAAAAPALLGFGLALAPVVARNLAVGAPPFALNATAGWTFVNHSAEDYDPDLGDAVSRHAAVLMERTGGRFLPAVVETLRTHPGPSSWLRQTWGKLLSFGHWYEVPNNASYYYYRLETPRSSLMALPFSFVAPLAAAGLLLVPRWTSAPALAAAHVACGLATLLATYNLSRLRLPVAVALVPFAAAGAVGILRVARAGDRRRLAMAAVAGIGLTVLVLRPLRSDLPLLRPADYTVPNTLAAEMAKRRAGTGDAPGALRLAERALAHEPADLRAAGPHERASRVSLVSAEVAGSFAGLHELASGLAAGLGRRDVAEAHGRRAVLLRVVAAQYERAKRTPASP